MAASTQQKLDYLLKKIGYTASKTGLAEDSSLSGTKKAPFAESIPSPLVTASSSIWTDSDNIPGTPPGSDSSYVKVYLASASGHRMTVDSTVSGSRAFIAYSTYNNTSTAILGDWIDTQFGDSYIIKVYKGDPNSGGTLLSAAGSGSNDTWFFDYASGVLNFNGTVVPSGVTDTNIYIVGYRYIGAKGTATAGINTEGTSTFENIVVDGNAGIGSLNVTGVSTFTGTSTFDGLVYFEGSEVRLGNSSSDMITGSGLFSRDITPNSSWDRNLGEADKQWQTLFSKQLKIVGISTLGITSTTWLESEQLNVTGVSTFAGITSVTSTHSALYVPQLSSSGVVTATTFSGSGASLTSIPNGALDNSTVSYGGVSLALGASDATPAFNLTDATNYPYTSLTGITTDIVGDTTPQLGGNLDGNSKSIFGVGVLTATTFDGNLATTNLTGTITNAQLAGSIVNSKLVNDSVSYGGVEVDLGASDATPAFNLTDATNYPYTSLTGITTDIVGDTTPTLGGDLDGNSKSIYGVGILTATTLDISGDVDIDGDTELDQVNVSAASTFGGLVDIDAGAQANTLKVEDLTDNRLVIAGTGGELEDSSKVTFDGTTFAILGDATFSGNVTIGGTLTKEDVTNIDAVGLITAQSGIRVVGGGVSVASGVATFSDSAYFPDNSKIKFGDAASPDLEIYHSGSESNIVDSGTGVLRIGASQLNITNAALTETQAKFMQNGAVELYHDNVKKFETTSTGSIVTGVLTATTFSGSGASLSSIPNSALDNSTVSYGGISLALGGTDATPAFDLTDATNYPYTSLTGVTTDILGDSSPQLGGDLDLNSKDITGSGNIDVTGALKVSGISTFVSAVGISSDLTLTNTDGGSAAGPEFKLFRNSASPADADYLGQIKFAGESDTGVERNYAKITGKILDASNGTEDGIIEFAHIKAGSQTITGRFRSDSLQLLNDTALSVAGDITANGNIAGDGSTNITGIAGVTASTLTGTLQTAAQTNITSVGTLSAVTVSGDITANGNITGDSATIISGISTVGATTYYGSGAHLTGISTAGINTEGTSTFEDITVNGNAGIGSLNVTGVSTFNNNVYLKDNDSLNFGNGNDLQIWHDASNSYILDQGVGDLIIGANDAVKITNAAGTENKIVATSDGSVDLYYDNAKKFETTSTGSIVTGVLTATTFSGNLTGTVNTAAQTNITSLGTLSAVTVSGDITANGNIVGDSSTNISGINSVTATTYYGDGQYLSGTGFTQDSEGNLVAGTGAGAARDADTCCNIMIGCNAGAALNEGDRNILIGMQAGESLTSGGNNIYMGAFAGGDKTVGDYNIALGLSAGKANEGSCNVFAGKYAGRDNTTGNYNVFLGLDAGKTVTTGADNIALGHGAMGTGLVTGSYNAVFGKEAGKALTSGSDNFIYGCRAACQATSAFNNIIIGKGAACGAVFTGNQNILMGTSVGKMLVGAYNIMFGLKSGCQLSNASANTFVGHYTAQNNTGNMCYSVAIGNKVDLPITSGNTQLAIGCNGSYWMVGNSSFNVGIGTTNPDAPVGSNNEKRLAVGILSAYQLYGDGSNLTNVGITTTVMKSDPQENLVAGTGAGAARDADTCFNILLGCSSGAALNAGDHNLFFGAYAGKPVTSGSCNIAIGFKAGCEMDNNEDFNVYIGRSAGQKAAGDANVAIGQGALYGGSPNIMGGNNIALGKDTMGTGNGGYNVAIGRQAGNSFTTGCKNVLLGTCAGCSISSGCCNISLGTHAGKNATTGNLNVALGYCVELPSATGSNQLVIGAVGNTWITGNANFNVGIGTTNPDITVGSGNTAKLSVGIVSAYQLYGDGSGLTGLAGWAPTTGSDGTGNLYAGTSAGEDSDTDTCYNIAVGLWAGKELNAGDYNVFFGAYAGSCITSKGCNVFIGMKAGKKLDTSCSVVIGPLAAFNTACDVSSSVLIGKLAGCEMTGNASDAILIGQEAGAKLGSFTNTIALGKNAGRYLSGSYNIVFGNHAGQGTLACGGADNFFAGHYSGLNHQSATGNIAIGKKSAQSLTTGNANIAIGCCVMSGGIVTGSYNFVGGYKAGEDISSGGCNVIIGYAAGCNNTTGNSNVAIGKYAMSNGITTGAGNIAIGENTLPALVGGACNIALGCKSSYGITSGTNNISLGRLSLFVNQTGVENVAIGREAGYNNYRHYNVFIGHKAGMGAAGYYASNNVAIGSSVEVPVVGGDNQLAIGAAGNTWIVGNANWNVGIGTTNPDTAVGAGNTAKLSVGIVSAYQLYGDGSNLTGAGFSPDDQGNLVAGTDAGAAKDADTYCNIMIGQGAGKALNDGDCNVFFGFCAGESETTGNENVFIGKKAGNCSLGNNCNTFIGNETGRNFCRGAFNVAIGEASLYGGDNGVGTSVCEGVFLGAKSGRNVREGSNSIFLGTYVGKNVHNAGSFNIAIGACSALGKTSGQTIGSNNVLIGRASAKCLTSGLNNVFVGGYSGWRIESGTYNTFFGHSAGNQVTTGGRNIFIGNEAGKCTSTGSGNIALGCGTGSHWGSGDNYNLAIGFASNNWIVGNSDYNVGIGTTNPNAVVTSGNTQKLSVGIVSAYQLYGDGSNLTNVGGGCLKLLETNNLVSDGTCAGCAINSDSDFNIILGCCAGVVKTGNGDNNIVIGHQAGKCSQSGDCQVLIGMCAGAKCNNTGNYGIMIGHWAGACNTTGQQNVFIGSEAGAQNNGGANHIYIGSGAGCNIGATEYFNIAIGCKAAFCMTGGSRNIILGCRVNAPILDGDNQLAIGIAQAYDSAVTDYWITGDSNMNVGIGTTVPTAAVSIGNTAVLSVGIVSAYQFYGVGSNLSGVSTAADFNSTSDIRLKTNIQPIEDPLAKVIKIEGVSFNWKEDNRSALGVIADQVEKILPELVHGDDPKTVNYNGLIGLLIEAVKEQQTQIDELNDRISKLE